MAYKAWQVEPCDDVAVVIQDVKKGSIIEIDDKNITANEDIPQGHKIAIFDIPLGYMVKKYSVPIGKATKNIKAGDHVHTHNLEDITEELCKEYNKKFTSKGGRISGKETIGI